MIEAVRKGLTSSYPAKLVNELLEAYTEAKDNFYAGGLRLSGVEGGRFCEAAFRLLQEAAYGKSDPLGRKLDSDGLIRGLGNLAAGSKPDSVRLHIPRALRVVYDIRNSRDTAHLADGIDPNAQDATVVVSILDWVLAEFVRLHHNVAADEAERIVSHLVSRKAPAVEDFGGFLKVLNPALKASDRVLLLLYHRGPTGATFSELGEWVHPKMRTNLGRTLESLVDDHAFVHSAGARYFITRTGLQHVEMRRLFATNQ